MGKNQHVTPHPAGGWQVKGEGNSKATVRTSTQKEAIDRAPRRIVRVDRHVNSESQVTEDGKQNMIRDKDSHGRDPFPPRG